MIRVGSLFSGIGGFDLGLERAGMEVAWQVEADPYRRLVLARHWPDVPRHRDVRAMDYRKVESVQLLCGGFPCTDLSYAGGGAGIKGRHSGLWREFARAIRDLGPRWVVVENVPALRDRGLDVVLGEMAALGYDAEWDCIPASSLGAHHERDRIWIVAYPRREGLESGRGPRDVGGTPARAGRQGLQRQRSRDAAGSGRGPLADSEVDPIRAGPDQGGAPALRGGRPGDGGVSVADPEPDRRHQGQDQGQGLGQQGRRPNPARLGPRLDWRRIGARRGWSAEPGVGRVADGVPARVDRLAALGDSLVPQIAEALGTAILAAEGDEVLA